MKAKVEQKVKLTLSEYEAELLSVLLAGVVVQRGDTSKAAIAIQQMSEELNDCVPDRFRTFDDVFTINASENWLEVKG